ncbi:hypothetical protein [Rhodoferax sp. TH121]|uniref:hypothetical protein n=1 Tax=Rhodoferax sp. TH121 TaxID=2022803 RepID=UPI0015956DB7|nr:hypothetical protein [Rhodoferax sp. TH121]
MYLLRTVWMACLAPGVWAQALAPEPVLPAAPMGASDRAMVHRADGQRQQLEDSVKDYLVAFDSRLAAPGVQPRKTVGLSLTNFSGSPLSLAYDPNGKSMMAQWRSSQTTAFGQTFQYQAFVGEAGAVNFVISSRF